MGTKNSGRQQQQDALKTVAQTKAAEAEQPDPLEDAQRARVQALEAWRSGTNGPPDVRNMPDQVGISLYKQARETTDAGRIGRGLNTLGEGANPNFTAALDKEDELERNLNASGQLEGYVSDRLDDLDAKELGLSARSDARRSAAADRAAQAYQAYVNRPRQPSFLKQLALGAISNAGLAAGLFTGGASTLATKSLGGSFSSGKI
jgi:hypothetical protein